MKACTDSKSASRSKTSSAPVNYSKYMKPISFDLTNFVFNIVVCLDFGSFRCISKNSIGQAEAVIELYGISQILTQFLL
jgi:hypothetical protein